MGLLGEGFLRVLERGLLDVCGCLLGRGFVGKNLTKQEFSKN